MLTKEQIEVFKRMAAKQKTEPITDSADYTKWEVEQWIQPEEVLMLVAEVERLQKGVNNGPTEPSADE